MADGSYQPKVYIAQGGDRLVIASGGVIDLEAGAVINVAGSQQAAIADLTFGTNIAAATANGALVDSSATNPTEAQFNELAKELGIKLNAILGVLRNLKAIAS